MKRRIFLSIALVLTIGFIALTNADSPARAQRNRLYVYDSGVVTLGANQTLVVTVSTNEATEIAFHEYAYGTDVCSGTICKSSLISEIQFPVVSLNAFESMRDGVTASPTVSGTRITVTTKKPDLRCNAQIKLEEVVISSFSFGANQTGN